MKNANYLSPDFLQIFENRVRSTGVWCDTGVKQQLRHLFVAKNPNSMLAISRCGTIIVRIEKLHENVLSQKCLVCELFSTGRKEALDKLDNQLLESLNEAEKNQTQDKE